VSAGISSMTDDVASLRQTLNEEALEPLTLEGFARPVPAFRVPALET
jgi:class 3 adenylate cyclase